MKKATLHELVVGIVFAVGVTVLGVYTIAVSNLRLAPPRQYLVDFAQVYGLKVGDAVRVEGFEKGQVTSLRLLPGGRVRAVLEVDDDVEVYRADSDVRVTPFSPLGGRVVEIRRGKESPRGAYTFFGKAQGAVDLEQADVIEGQAEGELLQTLNALVEENKQGVKQIVDNLTHVSNQLTKTDNVLGFLLNDAEAAQDVDGVVTSLRSSAGRLDAILGRVEAGKGVIGGLVTEGSPLERDVAGAVSAGRGALEGLEAIVQRADEGRSALGVFVSDDEEVSGAVRGIATDVKTITGRVAAGEGTVGRLVHDDRLYEGAARTAENLGEITQRVRDGQGVLGVLTEDESGKHARDTLRHLASVSAAIDDPEAGAIGLLVHDGALRGRVARTVENIERLVVELRDGLEDAREQAPVNAFVGAIFAAF